MELISTMLHFFEAYPAIVIIIVAFLGTEPLLFITFFAGAHSEIIPLWMIFVLGFFVALLADIVEYSIGKIEFVKGITPRFLRKNKYSDKLDKIKKLAHDNLFLILFISKFIYGFRQVFTVYLGYTHFRYRDFIKKDVPALLLFFAIMIPLAWFGGLSAGISFSGIKEIEISIAFGLVFILIVYFVANLIIRSLIKKSIRKN